MTRSIRNAGRQLKLLLLFLTIFFGSHLWPRGRGGAKRHLLDMFVSCTKYFDNDLASSGQQNPIEPQDMGTHSHLNEIIVFLVDSRKTYDVRRVTSRGKAGGETFNGLYLFAFRGTYGGNVNNCLKSRQSP